MTATAAKARQIANSLSPHMVGILGTAHINATCNATVIGQPRTVEALRRRGLIADDNRWTALGFQVAHLVLSGAPSMDDLHAAAHDEDADREDPLKMWLATPAPAHAVDLAEIVEDHKLDTPAAPREHAPDRVTYLTEDQVAPETMFDPELTYYADGTAVVMTARGERRCGNAAGRVSGHPYDFQRVVWADGGADNVAPHVLERLTGERIEVGTDGCGCPVTEEILPNGSSIEGTERVEHRPRCWNALVERVVDRAPALSAAQRDRLAGIFRPVAASSPGEQAPEWPRSVAHNANARTGAMLGELRDV